MTTTIETDSRRYAAIFRRVEGRRRKEVDRGVLEAAHAGASTVVVPAIKASVHRFTGALVSSVHVVKASAGPEIRVDAPHAGVIEGGARPHMPPIQPLIDWVTANRGAFGVKTPRPPRMPKFEPPTQLAAIARASKAALRFGDRRKAAESAISQIAWAVALHIKQFGSPPHWYMRGSLPDLRALLKAIVERRMHASG